MHEEALPALPSIEGAQWMALAPAASKSFFSISKSFLPTKGQLFSELIHEVIVSPKIQTKVVRISAHCSVGINPDNFLFVFWEKR